LGGAGHVANFVEKDRSTACLLEFANSAFVCKSQLKIAALGGRKVRR